MEPEAGPPYRPVIACLLLAFGVLQHLAALAAACHWHSAMQQRLTVLLKARLRFGDTFSHVSGMMLLTAQHGLHHDPLLQLQCALASVDSADLRPVGCNIKRHNPKFRLIMTRWPAQLPR